MEKIFNKNSTRTILSVIGIIIFMNLGKAYFNIDSYTDENFIKILFTGGGVLCIILKIFSYFSTKKAIANTSKKFPEDNIVNVLRFSNWLYVAGLFILGALSVNIYAFFNFQNLGTNFYVSSIGLFALSFYFLIAVSYTFILTDKHIIFYSTIIKKSGFFKVTQLEYENINNIRYSKIDFSNYIVIESKDKTAYKMAFLNKKITEVYNTIIALSEKGE